LDFNEYTDTSYNDEKEDDADDTSDNDNENDRTYNYLRGYVGGRWGSIAEATRKFKTSESNVGNG
jgi:hypothetical protein